MSGSVQNRHERVITVLTIIVGGAVEVMLVLAESGEENIGSNRV